MIDAVKVYEIDLRGDMKRQADAIMADVGAVSLWLEYPKQDPWTPTHWPDLRAFRRPAKPDLCAKMPNGSIRTIPFNTVNLP